MGEELTTVKVKQTCTVTTLQPGSPPVVGVVQPRTLSFRAVVSETPEYCVFESQFKGLSRYFVFPSRDVEITKPKIEFPGHLFSLVPQSDSVKLVRYDAACKVLYVTHSGSPEVEYAYADVPCPLWDRLAACHAKRESVGKFLSAHIKDIYSHSQVPST